MGQLLLRSDHMVLIPFIRSFMFLYLPGLCTVSSWQVRLNSVVACIRNVLSHSLLDKESLIVEGTVDIPALVTIPGTASSNSLTVLILETMTGTRSLPLNINLGSR